MASDGHDLVEWLVQGHQKHDKLKTSLVGQFQHFHLSKSVGK